MASWRLPPPAASAQGSLRLPVGAAPTLIPDGFRARLGRQVCHRDTVLSPTDRTMTLVPRHQEPIRSTGQRPGVASSHFPPPAASGHNARFGCQWERCPSWHIWAPSGPRKVPLFWEIPPFSVSGYPPCQSHIHRLVSAGRCNAMVGVSDEGAVGFHYSRGQVPGQSDVAVPAAPDLKPHQRVSYKLMSGCDGK